LNDIDIDPEESPASPAVAAALQSADDAVFRTGAALNAAQVARIVERRALDAEDAAAFRIHARTLGLLAAEPDEDDPVAQVERAGTTAALETDFTALHAFWQAARRYPC